MAARFFAWVDDIQMTVKQHALLCLLRTAHQKGDPPLNLESLHNPSDRMLETLRKRDWIVESWKLFNERRFSITGRGLKALATAESRPKKHAAGTLCFRCGIAPRHVYPGGRMIAYCQQCKTDTNRERYVRNGTNYSHGLCKACNQRPRASTETGYVYRFCQECRNQDVVAMNQRRAARMIATMQTGDVLMCTRCGQAPRHVTPSAPTTTCKTCTNILRVQRRRKLKVRRMAEKMGRKAS